MRATIPTAIARFTIPLALAAVLSACGERSVTTPDDGMASAPGLARASEPAELATLRRATARYHDLDAALADGFVFLSPCEVRGDEGAVGIMYVHFARLLDGRADPATPDALIYEPGNGGRPRLVAVELAIAYPHWTADEPPTFQGVEFEREDEFGVYGLHVWLWRRNPNGMFAETNPHVSC